MAVEEIIKWKTVSQNSQTMLFKNNFNKYILG